MVATDKPALTKVKKRRIKKKGPKKSAILKAVSDSTIEVETIKVPKAEINDAAMKDICERYPVLKNKELIQSFLAVPMNNNQRGRIRQVLKDRLKGSSAKLLPDMINSKIQSILKSSENLDEVELRKVRILFNMLKTASIEEISESKEKKPKEKKASSPSPENKKKSDSDKKEKNKSDVVKSPINSKSENDKSEGQGDKEDIKKAKKEADKKLTTAKGVKRYVVFVGNLPLGIDKDKLMLHFQDFSERIKDVRIPSVAEGKKSATAYVELKDELGYELALSKHHSMLGNKRINVLYTMQQNSKMSKEEAKSRSAKLIALQKSGQLLGSTPLNRKRSARRKKMKEARAREAAD